MRSRNLRRLYGSARRQARVRLLDTRDRRAGNKDHDHRSAVRRRHAQPCDAGLRRARRAAVRLLHAGIRGRNRAVSQAASQADRGRHSSRPERQLLPLRYLQWHPRRCPPPAGRETVMTQYSWPDPALRPLLGKKIDRIDGPSKSSGRAKYTYDYNPQGLLAGKILRCPYAHAKVTNLDTSAAEKIPGVKAVEVIQGPGSEIFWAGDEIVGVAAVDEGTCEDALRAIKVEYEVLPHFVSDAEPPKNIATDTGPISKDDFEDMLDNQVPDEQVVARLQRDGISFKPTEKDLASYKGEGADPSILTALQKAKFVAAEARPKTPYKKTATQTT